MQSGAIAVARPANTRSSVTNDPRRLSGVDMRSHAGRLFCDLYDSVAAEFPLADPGRIRQVALLRYELEKARAADTLTLEDSVRVHHLIDRREGSLRLAQQRQRLEQDKGQGLSAYLNSLPKAG